MKNQYPNPIPHPQRQLPLHHLRHQQLLHRPALHPNAPDRRRRRRPGRLQRQLGPLHLRQHHARRREHVHQWRLLAAGRDGDRDGRVSE